MPMAPDDPRRKNLKPPIKKGQVLNPTGKNGSEWLSEMRAYFAEKDVDFTAPKGVKNVAKVPRIRNVWAAMYRRALLGDGKAQEIISHYMQGPPRLAVELSGPDGAPLAGPQVVMYIPDDGSDGADDGGGDDPKTLPPSDETDVGTDGN